VDIVMSITTSQVSVKWRGGDRLPLQIGIVKYKHLFDARCDQSASKMRAARPCPETRRAVPPGFRRPRAAHGKQHAGFRSQVWRLKVRDACPFGANTGTGPADEILFFEGKYLF
jgi:hypothetical protein